jgi:hypothetical protein
MIYAYPYPYQNEATKKWAEKEQRDATRARPDWQHCTECRPFDATGKDQQVSEQAVAYHRIYILQRNDDTGYRPQWYDTEIRNKSGPGFTDTSKLDDASIFVTEPLTYDSIRTEFHIQTFDSWEREFADRQTDSMVISLNYFHFSNKESKR